MKNEKLNIDEIRNTILSGHSLDLLRKLPSESISCVVTSPPYWSLRDYGIEAETIWDGDENCEHEVENYKATLNHENRNNLVGPRDIANKTGTTHYFKDSKIKAGFCIKCGAWKGQLGLEPTFELYINHLCVLFDEIKRVLRKDGTCFVNIGDSYAGGGGGNYKDSISTYNSETKHPTNIKNKNNWLEQNNLLSKSLVGIPERFSLEMRNRGWILRNTIIWWKPNCMPSSSKDRFTVDFEYVYFFVKNNKTQFWVNEKTFQIVSKQPKGIKGIEGEDWRWEPCPRCNVGAIHELPESKKKIERSTKILEADAEKVGGPRARYHRKNETEKCKNKRCVDGKVKVSYWEGSDYWFEKQRIAYNGPLNRWGGDSLKKDTSKTQEYKDMQQIGYSSAFRVGRQMRPDSSGSNMRTVWKITTKGYAEAHFATYPVKLILPMLKAGCPEKICSVCGLPRVKIEKTTGGTIGNSWHDHSKDIIAGMSQTGKGELEKKGGEYKINFLGYSDCGCNADFVPGIVLDPFMGSGTTGRAAKLLQRDYIGLELNKKYIEMAERRIKLPFHTKPVKKEKPLEKQIEIF